MSVLVTGGAGYIGSHMVWHLVDAGESVVVLDNLVDRLCLGGRAGSHARPGRLRRPGPLVRRLIDEHEIDAIIHFAGSIVVPESVTDPLGYYLNNTVKSRALIEAAVHGGVRHFIFSSTAAVYGTPAASYPVSEDATLTPESPYGRSKLMTEMMLADASAAHGISLCRAPLFQRRRRRSARPHRPVDTRAPRI